MKFSRKVSTAVFAVLLLLVVFGVNKEICCAEDFSDAVTIQANQPVGGNVEKGYRDS